MRDSQACGIGFLLFLATSFGVIVGCAPDVQQSMQKAQHAEVMKLTADMGTPARIRSQVKDVATLLNVMAPYLAPGPNLTAEQATAMQSAQQALVTEAMRLNGVAMTQTDDDFAERVGDLCTPQAMTDAGYCQTVLNYTAQTAPAKISDNARAEQARQYLGNAALLMANIRGRCEQGNAELAGKAQQVEAQVKSAHRSQDILFELLAARLSAPRVSITNSATSY
jgi:hypothetical protein